MNFTGTLISCVSHKCYVGDSTAVSVTMEADLLNSGTSKIWCVFLKVECIHIRCIKQTGAVFFAFVDL